MKENIEYLKIELKGYEKELKDYILDFLHSKNKYGVNYITGVSFCLFIPSLDQKHDYMFKLISGTKKINSEDLIDENTIFDLASITKVFTLILLLKLVSLNYISLGEKICDINEDYKGLEDFTINDLMRLHGKLWTDGNIATAKTKDEATKILKTIHLIDNTRKENTYNDFGALIIGECLSKRMSKILNKNLTFEDLLKMYILEPLGMKNTVFGPKTNNIAGNGLDTLEANDPKARILGGACGHAGLFSSTDDFNILAREIFDSKINKGKVLNKEIVDKLGEITFPNSKQSSKGNLGTYVKCKEGLKSSYVSNLLGDGSFAQEGWTGSLVIFDPINRIHISMLVNAIYKSDITEEIENGKPAEYQDMNEKFQEETTPIIMKIKNICDLMQKTNN